MAKNPSQKEETAKQSHFNERNRPKDNADLFKQMMEFSAYGALAQMFIVQAVADFAEQVAKSDPEKYEKGLFVNPYSWVGVAKEIKEKMDEYYGWPTKKDKEG